MTKKIEYYEVEREPEFSKGVRWLAKKKRFVSLPGQLLGLEADLSKGSFPGDLISRREAPVLHEVYKLRLPNPDTNVGKSNGYRIIYIVVTERKVVVLLTIYYKKEDETVTDTFIDGLIAGYFLDDVPYDDEETNQDAE